MNLFVYDNDIRVYFLLMSIGLTHVCLKKIDIFVILFTTKLYSLELIMYVCASIYPLYGCISRATRYNSTPG